MIKRCLLLHGTFAVFSSLASLSAQTDSNERFAEDSTGPTVYETYSIKDRVTEPYQSVGYDSILAATSITRDALQSAPSGLSGLKMLEGVPGVVMSNSDALGLYEFGNQVLVRAFGFQQLGFSLDGIPMGRSAAFGGSPIYRYVDNENLFSIDVNQGGADVTVPSYTALGASMRYFTDTPKATPGGQLVTSVGDNNYLRGFLRVDTGEFAPGAKAYVSYSKIRANMWRGPNENDREHAEAKLVFAPSEALSLSFNAVYNNFNDGDFRFQSDGQVATFGRYFDYVDYIPVPPGITAATDEVSYDYNAAFDAWQANPQVGGLGGSGFFTLAPDGIPDYLQERMQARDANGNPTGAIISTPADENGMRVGDEYRGHINARQDALFGLSADYAISDSVTLDTTLYYEEKSGDGVSYDDFDGEVEHYIRQTSLGFDRAAPQGVLWGLTSLDGDRAGLRSSVEFELDNQTINAGFWFEEDEFTRNTNRYNIRDGLAQPQPLFDSRVFARRNFTQVTNVTQFWIQDSLSLNENRLNLVFGVKALDIDAQLDGYRHQEDYDVWSRVYDDFDGAHLDVGWSDSFLPVVGATYNLNSQYQLFGSFSESMASPTAESEDVLGRGDPRNYVAPGAPTAQNFDIGIRTNFNNFSSSVALYYSDFGNKLENVGFFDPAQNETFARWETVGGVEAYGMEIAFTYLPIALTENLAITGSFLLNEAKYQDDRGGRQGNTVEGTPDWSGFLSATYTPTKYLTMNLSANYMGERPRNSSNTIIAEDYTTLSAYIELRGGALKESLEPYKLRMNITNLTDEEAFGNIFSVGGRVIQDRFIQLSLIADF